MQNVLGFFVLFVILFVVLSMCSDSNDRSGFGSADTYRLVHARGNSENIIARGLSRPECESRKREFESVASGLGMGQGSVTCLPESLF